jgi:hypothetical protein
MLHGLLAQILLSKSTDVLGFPEYPKYPEYSRAAPDRYIALPNTRIHMPTQKKTEATPAEAETASVLIRIKPTVRKALGKKRRGGESYSDVIERLLRLGKNP